MDIIQVSHLSKSFGKVKALNDVNLTVTKGEIHGFIGPNGAGKSTTIRVLLGMLKADEGEIRILNKDAWKDAMDVHKDIAYIPGDANLWPNLTGGQVIDLLLDMRGKEVDKDKKDHLIKEFEFDPTKKCRTYSKGNLQKILIIAAFAADAELYLLDEPTSGLDPLMERKFQAHLMQLKAEGKTILLSSHILSEVEKLCDTISIIRRGTIIESGALDDLRHLTRMNYVVETQESIEELSKIVGISQLKRDGVRWSFQVDSEYTDQILKELSRYDVNYLNVMPPKLEDIFIRYYEDNKEGVEAND